MSVAIAPEPTRPDPPESQAVPVAVVGAGRVGLAVAAILATHANARLAGLVDGRRELRRFARDAGFRVPAEARPERLAARVKFAAAIVCAPADVRDALTLEVLGTGASVLALAPCDPGATPGSPLRVASPLLFQSLYARAIELAHAGPLGPLRRVQLSAYASRVFGPGSRPRRGDVLDHYGVAALRLLDALLGPVQVTRCETHAFYGAGPDEVHARFSAPGVEASLDASWSVPGYPRPAVVIEAEGDSGRLLLADDALEIELSAAASGLPAGTSRWTLADMAAGTRFETGGPGLAPMLDAFLAEWEGAVSPRFDPASARRTQTLVDAVRAAGVTL